nr:hypothetical protein Itr_chr05CG18050 [Ipomoea trifida]
MRHKVSDGTAAAAAAELCHKKNPKAKSFSRRGQIKMRIASLAFELLLSMIRVTPSSSRPSNSTKKS